MLGRFNILCVICSYVYKCHCIYIIWQGSRDGAVVRALAFHKCVAGSIPGPGVICGLSLLLVLFFAPRDFSQGTPVFPSPQKPFTTQCLKTSFICWIVEFVFLAVLFTNVNTNLMSHTGSTCAITRARGS